MSHSTLLEAQATRAGAEAAISQARSARADAATLCDAARSSYLQAIQIRYAAGRLHRARHGPIYAMAHDGHAVEAHRLLGSSAVVCTAIATLQDLWEELPAQEVERLLDRLARHASTVDHALKAIANGVDPGSAGGAPDADGSGNGAAGHPSTVEVRTPVHAHTDGVRLTSRESEVLTLLVRGLSNDEIADAIFVSVETVRSHVKHVYRKLGARHRAHAVTLAYTTGLVQPNGAG